MRNKSGPMIIAFVVILVILIGLFLVLLRAPFSYIWVMDQGKNLNEDFVIKMCPDGTRLVEIQFGSTDAIGADPNTGNIWTTELMDKGDVNRDQVVKIDQDGNILDRYPGYRTYIFAVDPRDGSVWVGLVNENLVVKLNPEGELVLEVAGFQAPRSIAVNPEDGSIWVADNGRNNHLVHLSAEGVELFRTQTGGFFSASPHQVAVDPHSGNVWYAGSFDESVYLRSAEGEMLAEIGGFDSPVAISVSPRDGSSWVADYSRDQSGAVVKLDSSGNVLLKEVLDKPPRSIGFNAFDETVWVGIDGAAVKLSSEGKIIQYLSGFTLPYSFAFVEIYTLPAKLDYLSTCILKTRGGFPVTKLKDQAVDAETQTTLIVVTPSPVPTPTPTPTPSPTPDICSPSYWEKNGINILSYQVFSALDPGGPNAFDRILISKNPAWEDFLQEDHGEKRTAGVIFHEHAWGNVMGTGVNPAVLFVTYGVERDWELPAYGALVAKVDQMRNSLVKSEQDWFHGRVDKTQYPLISNPSSYAIYQYFDGNILALESWCRTYHDVFGESPIK